MCINLKRLNYSSRKWGYEPTYQLCPHLFENKQNSNPHSLCNVGEILPWLIKSNCFTYFLLQIKPVIIKKSNFKFENVSFTKLPEKILMIRHITYNVIIKLKWRKYNNFFKPLINGNIKYTKSLIFVLIFIYFEGPYFDTA